MEPPSTTVQDGDRGSAARLSEDRQCQSFGGHPAGHQVAQQGSGVLPHCRKYQPSGVRSSDTKYFDLWLGPDGIRGHKRRRGLSALGGQVQEPAVLRLAEQ